MNDSLSGASATSRARTCLSFAVLIGAMLTTFDAHGDDALAPPTSAGPAVAPPADEIPQKPKPPAYSLPWQLRPAAAANVVRSDTAVGFRKVAGKRGNTVATTILGSYKLAPDFAALLRLGVVNDDPPTGANGFAFLNPVVGATYVIKLTPAVRLALFTGMTLPIGSGGGNAPDKAVRGALGPGISTRSAFDNAMFAVNYMTFFPGIDLAYVASGLTIQVEATVFELIRVRGNLVDKDTTRTNFTTGLHIGYFLSPALSIGAELRYQAWIANPTLANGAAARDTLTAAIGPRLHFKLGDTTWFRPGIAYARGFDNPMSDQEYHIVQLDLPIAF